MAIAVEREHELTNGSPVDPAEQEADIRPLLARANLLRLREQWEEAIAVCTAALNQAPLSATAHSLLGDIYEAQGRLDEAIQWYGMAVDLTPENSVDRGKLNRAMQTQRALLTTREMRIAATLPPGATASSAPAFQRPASEKTIEWFDKMFPPGRTDSISRLILTVCGSIAVILVLGAILLNIVFHRSSGNSTLWTGPVANNLRPPVVMMPVSTQEHLRATADAALPPTGLRTSPPSVVSSPVTASDTFPANEDLRAKIAASLPVGLNVTAASAAPASGPVSLEIAIPVIAAESSERTRERVIRAAALAAEVSSQTLPRDEVHVAVQLMEAGRAHGADAFSADIQPGTLRGQDISSVSTLDLMGRFRSLQWSPNLAASEDRAVSSVPAETPAAAAAVPAATTPSPSPSPTFQAPATN